jgi:hypothetical protein
MPRSVVEVWMLIMAGDGERTHDMTWILELEVEQTPEKSQGFGTYFDLFTPLSASPLVSLLPVL